MGLFLMGLGLGITNQSKKMIPKYEKPNNSALFIGRTETNDGLQEYWILPPSNGCVHVFIVIDDSGSFVTRSLLYSQEGPVLTVSGWPEPNWFRHCHLGILYMSVPESSCYLGMHSIVFEYIWNMLYENGGESGFGMKLHPDGHHVMEVTSYLMRVLTKAGMPLTEEQDMFLFENYLMRK